MNPFQRLRRSRFWIRLNHWEFWPMSVTYFPVIIYYLYLSLRARSFGFFAAADPGIPYGGMRGEPKYDILKKLPPEYLPKTVFIPKGTPWAEARRMVDEAGIGFPLIGKPDIGERGICVKKIDSPAEFGDYHHRMEGLDYMAQAYVPYEEEYSILHYVMPGESKGEITSITTKGFLKVVGDGTSTVERLILNSPRATLQLRRLRPLLGDRLNEVPAEGEVFPLGLIGNHSLGTEFINHSHRIDQRLTDVFDNITNSMEGVFFARYDLRCRSFEEMREGRGIYILEVNGTGAEAAHIYDTRMGMAERYRVMFKHWRIIFDIARANHKRGVPYMSLRELRAWRRHMDAYYPKTEATGL